MEELILQVKEAVAFWVKEIESVCAYDTAKAYGGEIELPFEQAVSEIEPVTLTILAVNADKFNEAKI